MKSLSLPNQVDTQNTPGSVLLGYGLAYRKGNGVIAIIPKGAKRLPFQKSSFLSFALVFSERWNALVATSI
jgi:hypothetical protein